jgi:TolA-binding protein
MTRRWIAAASMAAILAVPVLARQTADEQVARRQLESGRNFARQGKFTEALKDFRAVADTHGSTSVADNALLEIARYYLDVEGDRAQAEAAVDTILKKYATSDSAPDAHLMMGRLALARGRGPSDLDAALANFDRVLALFPASDAVPPALVLTGETMWHAGRLDDALANLGRVQVEYSAHDAAADAYVAAGRVLVSQGDPILAMEEMQQARNRWGNSPAAARALSRISLLHRLYVRSKGGPAYAAAADQIGPARLEGVTSLVVTPRNAVFFANENGIGAATTGAVEKLPQAQRPRALTVDATGDLFVLEGMQLRGAAGTPISLVRPRTEGDPQPLEDITGIVQLSTGDWLVADGDTRSIHKFSRTGAYDGVWAAAKVARLAVNAIDQVAGIDRDQKMIITFDRTGKPIDRLPLKGAGYLFENPVDLTFDLFGHLYVLDREAIGVFSPHPPSKVAAAKQAAPGTPQIISTVIPAERAKPGAIAPSTYRLLTVFSEMATKSPTAFRRATAFAVDDAGAIYLADDRAQRIRVYR